MKSTKGDRSRGFSLFVALVVTLAAVAPFLSSPAYGDDKQEAGQLVEKARFTLESFMSDDENMGAFKDLVKRAKGMCIIPSLLKGAFIVGASGGSGVMIARGQKAGWSGPAFYTVGGASFGLQIGGQASEVILLAMTDRGVTAFLSNNLKLGADVGVAAGPVGVGVSAATANLSADILSFARSKGVYGGISLDGAVVAVRNGLNEAYYGRGLTPSDILVRRQGDNQYGSGLIGAVQKATGRK